MKSIYKSFYGIGTILKIFMFMELVLLEIDYYCIPLKLRQLDYTEAKRNVGAKLPELNGFLYVNYEIVKRL